jgi:hypothetical protein
MVSSHHKPTQHVNSWTGSSLRLLPLDARTWPARDPYSRRALPSASDIPPFAPRWLRHGGGATPVRVVDGLIILESPKLRNPLPNILTVRIELLALQERVEDDAEVRLWIGPRAGPEPPAAVVGREVVKCSMKYRSPRRQSIIKSLERDEATIMQLRLCIQASCQIWRMAASTMGKPVLPSTPVANWDSSYSHSMLVYSGLKHLFMLTAVLRHLLGESRESTILTR